MSPQKTELEDDLLQLPPLDDDGESASAEDWDDLDRDFDEDHDGGLDDATSEDDPLERWAGLGGLDEEGSLLDAGEAEGVLVDASADDLLEGAEVGLLDDSDEGDGRDATDDDVGALEGDEPHEDDGGAEGTGEDPSAVLEAEPAAPIGEPGDDDALEDDARFSEAARLREEREPWPPRVDAAWSVGRVEPSEAPFPGAADTGGLAAVVRDGALAISTDGGATWARVPGCHGVTATAISPSAVVAALYDPLREASAVVVVRVHDGETNAALVADFFAEEGEDDEVRIVRLRGREVATEGRTALEILAETETTTFLLRARG